MSEPKPIGFIPKWLQDPDFADMPDFTVGTYDESESEGITMSDTTSKPAPSGWARQIKNGRVTIAFPVTPAERDLLRAAAKADGAQTVAAFVRRIALAEVKRLGNKAKK